MLRSVLKLKTFKNKTVALIGVLCSTWALYPQSIWTKSWSLESLDHVVLALPYASTVSLSNHPDNTLVISYQTEGELQDQMGLRSQLDNQQLVLTEFRNPLLSNPGDKLSAHKVIASSIQIQAPSSLAIELNIKQGQLKVQGQYETLNIQMQTGNCYLDLQKTKGRLKTRSALVQIIHQDMQLWAKSQGKLLSCSTASTGVIFQILNLQGSVDCKAR